MELRNNPLCCVFSRYPLYSDLEQIKKTLNNINPEIITLKIERHGIRE